MFTPTLKSNRNQRDLTSNKIRVKNRKICINRLMLLLSWTFLATCGWASALKKKSCYHFDLDIPWQEDGMHAYKNGMWGWENIHKHITSSKTRYFPYLKTDYSAAKWVQLSGWSVCELIYWVCLSVNGNTSHLTGCNRRGPDTCRITIQRNQGEKEFVLCDNTK